jgi:RND family efflux transporter MFP subunit
MLLPLLAALIGGLQFFGAKPGAAENAEPVGQVAQVAFGDLSVRVLATGRVEPDLQAQIRSRVGGVVASVLVKEGEFGKRGQVLLEIDATDYRREVERANAQVSQRRAQSGLALHRLVTVNNGLARRVIADVELPAVHAELAVARAQLKAALVEQRAARDRVRYATLVAPFDGTIINRSVQLGEMVVPTGNVEGRPLLVIGDIASLIIRAELNQVDFARVAQGNEAKVTFDALPGDTFDAELTALPASSSKNLSGAEVFSVKLRLLQAPEKLAAVKPGMNGDVDIRLRTRKHVLLVPLAAIHTDKARRTVEVWSEQEKRFQSRDIVIGESDDEKVEILKGLKEGDRVSTDGKGAQVAP